MWVGWWARGRREEGRGGLERTVEERLEEGREEGREEGEGGLERTVDVRREERPEEGPEEDGRGETRKTLWAGSAGPWCTTAAADA